MVYVVQEFETFTGTWSNVRNMDPKGNLNEAKKEAIKKRNRIEKLNIKDACDLRPHAQRKGCDILPMRVVEIVNGKRKNFYPATKNDEKLYLHNKKYYHADDKVVMKPRIYRT